MDKMNKKITTEQRKPTMVLRKGSSAPVVKHVMSLVKFGHNSYSVISLERK